MGFAPNLKKLLFQIYKVNFRISPIKNPDGWVEVKAVTRNVAHFLQFGILSFEESPFEHLDPARITSEGTIRQKNAFGIVGTTCQNKR